MTAGDLMAPKRVSVDPSRSPDETFDLWSIPAFDRGAPDVLTGGSIGSQKQLVEAGDVLLSKIVPHIRRAWVVEPTSEHRQIASSEWIVFRAPSAEPRYLRHLLVSNVFHLEFMNTVSGVGGSLLRARPSYVAQIQVPLPPIEEQRRIAAILDKADDLRAKRRAALADVDSLTQSIFHDMFGDPAVNQLGFPQMSLGSVSEKFSDGPFGSNLKSVHYVETGVRVIRLQNIGVGRFVDGDHAYVSPSHFDSLRKHECRPGDVLVGTLGDPNLRACVQPPSVPVALNKADCVQIRPKSELANGDFLCALLNSHSVRGLALGMAHGQTRSRISMGQLRQLRVPIPPIAMQAEFASRTRDLFALDSLAGNSASELEELFASLQHRAFSGQL